MHSTRLTGVESYSEQRKETGAKRVCLDGQSRVRLDGESPHD
jgi:hypothetical protein